MRALLITLNVILAGALLFALGAAFDGVFSGDNGGYTVKKRTGTVKMVAGSKQEAEPEPEFAVSHEQMIKNIVSADVFNSERSPNSAFNGRGGRVEMTLVGTFRIGKTEGAIIRQNRVNRQFNPFIMMMGPGIGGSSDSWGVSRNQQSGNRGGGNNGRSRAAGSSFRQRFQNVSRMKGQNQNQNTNLAFKQYVKVGETLSNGYTLVEVSRVRAVLTRGSDRMELELQDPSKSRTASRSGGGQKLNVNQQLQQAQILTNQRMMQVMQQMQRSMQGGGNRGGATPRGRGR